MSHSAFIVQLKSIVLLFIIASLTACGGSEDATTPPEVIPIVTDSDNDGIEDSLDNCPNTPSDTTVDANGCALVTVTDSDNDGVEDTLDNCPNTPSDSSVDSTGCVIITVTDSDNDGIEDSLDNCPNTPSDTTVDANGCALVTVTDSDNDGVEDILDNCPNTPSDSSVDSTGCVIITVTDSDNDGVEDTLDNCPNTPSDTTVDAKGCAVITTQPAVVLIQAEDYDDYHDLTTENQGGAPYRNDGVDIEVTTDQGGGYNIGYTQPSEWLSYQVTLAAGTYAISTRVASQTGNAQYSVSIDNNIIATDSVGATGGWQTYQTHELATFSVESGQHILRLDVISEAFNFNWLQIERVIDSDNDGVRDTLDSCIDTPAGAVINSQGCPDSDNDGVFDNRDSCPLTPADSYVDSSGCIAVQPLQEVAYENKRLTGGPDSALPGFTLYIFANDSESISTCNGGCAQQWPPVRVTDGIASGVPNLTTITRDDGSLQVAYQGRPLYFYLGDSNALDMLGAAIDGWDIQEFGLFGNLVPLYSSTTLLEHDLVETTADAVITRFADRGRDRHAKEDQFQQYDHYLSHYWTHRTARYKFTDYVAKGGTTIFVEWVTQWQLDALEFRAWYSGMNTVAQYHGNFGPDVVTVASGTFDDQLNQTSSTGDQYKYALTINEYRDVNGSREPLAVGQHMEIEVSQFLLGVPEGRANYYGTTYLYQIGVGGMVPWKTVGDFDDKSSQRENSHPIAQNGWLGGNTTLPYQYTNEPNDHFMQMATNLSSLNGQAFVLGRRIHHTSFVDGAHDEAVENGIFPAMIGKSGPHFINHSCASCHERNGRAAPADNGVPLDKWVFKIGDINGESESARGNVLQPSRTTGASDEGTVAIASWTDVDGLRSPNYQFSGDTPARFSARIAPQLVGLGLLEAIPEQTIVALEDINDEVAPFGISGKMQQVLDPVSGELRLGRFGWKAATSSIRHQVAAALNTDMGVTTSILPQVDCGATQRENNECTLADVELADEHLDNLVKYIALLGVRAQRNLDDAQVQQGQATFTTIGCSDCHTPTHQTSEYHPFSELRDQTIHPYTDLLLHDMGPGLADNLGEGNATGAEWRTTPLWGLGLSACVTGGVVNTIGGQGNEACTPQHSYLHDGRARSIEEAILWHGGEGQQSTTKYQQLANEEQLSLLAFLRSL